MCNINSNLFSTKSNFFTTMLYKGDLVSYRVMHLLILQFVTQFVSCVQKTVGYFATRCEQIIELAMKWAPLETKAILEVQVCMHMNCL